MVAHHNTFNTVRDYRTIRVRPPTVSDLKDNRLTPNAAIDAQVLKGIAALQAIFKDVNPALGQKDGGEKVLELLRQAEDKTEEPEGR